jgi:aspartokinase/homoserine dehydrogenase 1
VCRCYRRRTNEKCSRCCWAIFEGLGKNGINVIAIAQGSSELNISFVISKHDEAKALNAIHDSFFLSNTKRIHVFMIGVGLIGSTLLRQMRRAE